MAFKHHISFATDFAAIDPELRLTCFCMQPSEVVVLIDSNLSRLPFLRQVVDLDVLLCTGFNLEHAVLFLDQWLIKDWAKQWVLLCSAIPSKISFYMKKLWLIVAGNLQSIKTLLTLELSRYHKSGSTLSSSEPVTAGSHCSCLRNALCLCLPVRFTQAVWL